MGLCDPKAVRAGRPWHEQVNDPGFMRGRVSGSDARPMLSRDNKSSLSNTKENEMLPSSIATLAGEALDAACLHIQEKLGQDDGGVAGIFFSGPEGEQMIRTFAEYIQLELSMKEPS